MTNPKNAAWYGGGTIGLIGSQPSVGTIYYVNNATGSNSNNGLTPTTAFKTMTYADSVVTANADDYIFVTNWASTDEAFPITLSKAKSHWIGQPSQANPSSFINAPGDTACLLLQGSNIEIAGFEFSAGAAHACIETSGGLWKVNIHHNFFAWQDAAKYGIWLSNTTDNADCPHWHIWNNWFGNKMTDHNIWIPYNSTRTVIEKNVFAGVASGKIGVYVDNQMADGLILDNTFKVADAGDGEAITIDATSAGGLVIFGNRAGEGAAAMTQTPYRDLGATKSNWGVNYYDIRAIMPVTA